VNWIAFWFLQLTLSNKSFFLQLLSSLNILQICLELLLRPCKLMKLFKNILLWLKPSALLIYGRGKGQIFFRLDFLSFLAVVFMLFLNEPLDVAFLSYQLLAFLNHLFLRDFWLRFWFLWGSGCKLINIDVNPVAVDYWEVLCLVVIILDGLMVKSLSLTFVLFLR
jgi:hypothetical protein